MSSHKPRRSGAISSDLKLGVAGCCLAAASASFGLAMMIRGPSENFGRSGAFTVFAQFANKEGGRPGSQDSSARSFGDLDTETTATIPQKHGSALASATTRDFGDAAGIHIASVGVDRAVLLIAGRLQTVHVGDQLAALGEVLQISAGSPPAIVTSRGVIHGAGQR